MPCIAPKRPTTAEESRSPPRGSATRTRNSNAQSADLDEAIRSYGKAFSLGDDHYHGINYAFMLSARARASAAKRDDIADFVWAERVRRRVIDLCEAILNAPKKRKDAEDVDGEQKFWREQVFWMRASLIEALLGAGQMARADTLKAEAIPQAPEIWMAETLQSQLDKLAQLLANPPC